MFKKPFSFSGRIRRKEYVLSMLILVGACLIISITIDLLTNIIGEHAAAAALVFLIPALWFWIAQTTKRCHDCGHSGFYQLIPFYRYYLLICDSEFGQNEYGMNPKEKGNFGDVNEFGKYLQE